MKLTKGKLSKILDKKKQTMKKYKNKISNEKNKTYKNKRSLINISPQNIAGTCEFTSTEYI